MPELPETEALRRQLEKEYAGKRIKAVNIKTPGFVKQIHVGKTKAQRVPITPREVNKRLAGAKVKAVLRKGKFIAMELDGANYLVFHLGMSGHLVRPESRRPPDKHTHVVIEFSQGPSLRYFDARRFGEVFVASADDYNAVMANLGLDAVNDPIPWQLFWDLVAERRTKMKALLMDQEFMAGLGNIYSDEILFAAGLGYDRSSDTLTSNEVRKLTRAMNEVLHDGIRHRGTTLGDGEWRDLYDQPGEHQDHLNVHGREGLPCRRCRTAIRRVKVNGRSHYFCPQCQSVKVGRAKPPAPAAIRGVKLLVPSAAAAEPKAASAGSAKAAKKPAAKPKAKAAAKPKAAPKAKAVAKPKPGSKVRAAEKPKAKPKAAPKPKAKPKAAAKAKAKPAAKPKPAPKGKAAAKAQAKPKAKAKLKPKSAPKAKAKVKAAPKGKTGAKGRPAGRAKR